MYLILRGDDKLKFKTNGYIRICILIVMIVLIGISYTIYYAFSHNGQGIYQSYGINQVININPSLTFFQIAVIVLLCLGLVGAILFLAYTKGGKIGPEQLLENEEKSIFFALETVLFTILLTLIIVIPTNIMLEKYNKSDDYQNTIETNGNTINSSINWNQYN